MTSAESAMRRIPVRAVPYNLKGQNPVTALPGPVM